MDKKNLAFGRSNFIMLGVSMFVVIVGFILMSGPGSDATAFNEDIFSAIRIKVAPVVCFIGFISMIYAIIHRPVDRGGNDLVKKNQQTEVLPSKANKKEVKK